MNQLVRVFKAFIMRDLLYILGGSLVILSFLHLFNQLDLVRDAPVVYLLLGAGIAYAIGYAIQDGLCLTPWMKTGSYLEPRGLTQILFRLFVGREWERIPDFDYEVAMTLIDRRAPRRSIDRLERTIALKHVGVTIGSCGLSAGILLAINAVCTKVAFDIAIASATLVLSTILSALGAVKRAQQRRQISGLFRVLERQPEARRGRPKKKEANVAVPAP